MTELYIVFEGGIDLSSTKQLHDALASSSEKGYTKINIIFSSGGGNIYLGFFLANAIQNSRVPVRIHANNRIDSIANIIYLSAKERTAESFARFYLHGASITLKDGYKKDFEEMVNSLQVENERTAQYVADNTGLPVEKVSGLMEKRGSLSAQEALGYGIVKSMAHLEIPHGAARVEIPYILHTKND